MFRIQCVDAVALQAMLQQHPSWAGEKVQAGSCGENWRGVHGLFFVEWRGKQEVQKDRRQRLKSFERRLSEWFRNKEERQDRRGRVARPGEKVVWRKIGALKWRERRWKLKEDVKQT